LTETAKIDLKNMKKLVLLRTTRTKDKIKSKNRQLSTPKPLRFAVKPAKSAETQPATILCQNEPAMRLTHARLRCATEPCLKRQRDNEKNSLKYFKNSEYGYQRPTY